MVDPPRGETAGVPGRFAGSIELAVGVRIAERYRIERWLGEGGTSAVVACVDEQDGGKQVAVKLLRVPHPKDAERLIREARILAALESEHITRLVDSGTLESGDPYLVTELVDGRDLAALLRERGRLEVAEACDIVVQACLALEEAHAKGIVHRDIKPGNVLLTQRADGTNLVKLVDFGISRSVAEGADDGTLTESNELLGTPRYMALEQIKDPRSADARADIFSLGALLYRLLTGDYAFHGETAAEVIINIASMPAPSLLEARPDAPAALDAIVRKCLAKSVEARIQTAGELRKLITGTIGGASLAAHDLPREAPFATTPRLEPLSPGSPAISTPAPPGASIPPPATPSKPARGTAKLALAGAALLLVAAALVVGRATRREHETLPLGPAVTVASMTGSAAPAPPPQEASSIAVTPSAAASPPAVGTSRVTHPVRAQAKGQGRHTAPSNSAPTAKEPDVDVDTSMRQ